MADFTMPRLGADMEEATLVQWRVRPGDSIHRGQVIADVDTTKGVIEIECFEPGVIEKLVAREGETLPVGATLAVIRSRVTDVSTGSPSADDSPLVARQGAETAPQTPRKTPTIGTSVGSAQPVDSAGRRRITPLARRLAAERHIDWSRVTGSGASGEITAEDVERFAAARPAVSVPTKTRDSVSAAEENRSRLRTAIAGAMAKSKREIPHYYLQTPIDMSRALSWLEQENQRRPITKRLLPVVLSLKALAQALRAAPQLNGHWVDGQFRNHDSIHIGFAIAMKGGGLVAPAIHDVDLKNLDELMEALIELIPRARTGPLRSSEMSDATITLTSLGDLGVATVFGVIYPPQVALVGLGKITPSPWVDHDQVVVRPVMTASLSGDHRATDGQSGAHLLEEFNRRLQNPELL